jgi:hypothetical protein
MKSSLCICVSRLSAVEPIDLFSQSSYERYAIKAQLDGGGLGSFDVITDVIDKESFISRNHCSRT